MTDSLKPPLRLTILSSSEKQAAGRARELEKTLNGTAAGIGWDLGELEDPNPGAETLGEKFELKVFQHPPAGAAPDWLDATLHSIVVVLVDDALLKDGETMKWLAACAEHLPRAPKRHSLIAVPFSDELQQKWGSRPFLGDFQTLRWTALDPESAGRADQLALRVLHALIHTLARPVFSMYGWKLRLFLSHAKLDGYLLAQSVRHFVDQQHWLDSFYDARDIEAGASWKDELREGVAHSVLLVLRTDAYDRRLWCRQEVRWAAAFGVPRVVVDARSGLVYPASDLALEAAPTIRVPDGNLSRILFAALQTALRSMLFQRRVKELQRLAQLPQEEGALHVFPTTPNIDALVHACRLFRDAGTRSGCFIYPDPPLREGLREAAEALAREVGARLVTPAQAWVEVGP